MLKLMNLHTETLHDSHDFFLHWKKIIYLRQELGVEDDVLLDPRHFVAGLDDSRQSCSVACWSGGRLVGLVYATQHVEHGLPTGYAIGGDFTGRGLLLCHQDHANQVLNSAVEHIIASGVHSLHLRLCPNSDIKISAKNADMKYVEGDIFGDRVALTSSFDEFLSTLGKHTRRNVRSYMRKVTEIGMVFEPSLSQQEYMAAVKDLNAKTKFPASQWHLSRDERILAAHDGGQRFGLRGPDGRLVSVFCGFKYGSRYHLLTQLNSMSYENLSLSMALRGFAIEYLIQTGCKELQFMGGTSMNFARFCQPLAYRSVFIDKKKCLSSFFKRLLSKLAVSLAQMHVPVPQPVFALCSSYVDELKLALRTALAPSIYEFPRKFTSLKAAIPASAHVHPAVNIKHMPGDVASLFGS